MPQKRLAFPIAAAIVAALLAVPAAAQDYYAGKTIDFVIGGNPGGGFDIYARAMARHLSRHIPGAPAIVAKNMPGAGSTKAGAHVSTIAPRDGLTLGAVTPGAITGPLFDDKPSGLFPANKVQWIGSANSSTRICATFERSKIATIKDMFTHRTVIGGGSYGDATHDYAHMVRKTTDAKIDVIGGYKGTLDTTLAMERGEIDGMCGWDWSSAKSQKPEWIRDGKLRLLMQIGATPEDELTKLGAQPLWKYVKGDTNRQVVELIVSQQAFQRPYSFTATRRWSTSASCARRSMPPWPTRSSRRMQPRCGSTFRRCPVRPFRSSCRSSTQHQSRLSNKRGARSGLKPVARAFRCTASGTRQATQRRKRRTAIWLSHIGGCSSVAPYSSGSFEMFATRNSLPCLIAGSVAAALAATPAVAQDYYAGKTIEFIVGGDSGGGYDIYARAVARHLARHIPGNPTIVVKNMPGAGSTRAGIYISTVAPKDGGSVGALMPGAIVGPLLEDKPMTQFDPTKVIYIGTADTGVRVCATYENSKIKTFAAAQQNKAIVGASSAGGATRDYAFLHNHTAGTKFSVVAGYKGTVDIALAMERGEVDGLCGWDWSSVKSQKGEWVRDKKLNILVQVGLDPQHELTDMGVPSIWTFVKNENDRRVAELVVSQQVFQRSYIVPPGTPADQVKILRTAFDATMKDPQFLADAKKMKISITPLSGQQVQDIVTKLYATPRELVERARAAIKP